MLVIVSYHLSQRKRGNTTEYHGDNSTSAVITFQPKTIGNISVIEQVTAERDGHTPWVIMGVLARGSLVRKDLSEGLNFGWLTYGRVRGSQGFPLDQMLWDSESSAVIGHLHTAYLEGSPTRMRLEL